MFTAGDGPEEFKLDLSLNFILAEVCSAYLDLVPFKDAAFGPLNLRLVDRCVLSWRNIPVNDEEAESGIGKRADWVKNGNLCVGRGGHLLRLDNDTTRLTHGPFLIHKILRHDLVT